MAQHITWTHGGYCDDCGKNVAHRIAVKAPPPVVRLLPLRSLVLGFKGGAI